MNEALDQLYRIAALIDYAILMLLVIAVEHAILIYYVRKGSKDGIRPSPRDVGEDAQRPMPRS